MTRFLLCDVKWPHDLRNMWLFKWEPLALRLMLWSWRLYVLWDWRCSTFILSRNITWLHDQKFMWLGKLPMSQVWYLQVLWKWRYSAFFCHATSQDHMIKRTCDLISGSPSTWRRTQSSETIFDNWKPFKNYEKCFLFHLKSPFCSQDISVFVSTFCSCRKTTRLET